MTRFIVQPIHIKRESPQYLLKGPQGRFVSRDGKEKPKRI